MAFWESEAGRCKATVCIVDYRKTVRFKNHTDASRCTRQQVHSDLHGAEEKKPRASPVLGRRADGSHAAVSKESSLHVTKGSHRDCTAGSVLPGSLQGRRPRAPSPREPRETSLPATGRQPCKPKAGFSPPLQGGLSAAARGFCLHLPQS